MNITRHYVKHPLRGYPVYPSRGLMLTCFMVEVNGDKVFRRVYERWDSTLPSRSKHVAGQPVPCFKVHDVLHDLTQEQRDQIGWKLKGYNK